VYAFNMHGIFVLTLSLDCLFHAEPQEWAFPVAGCKNKYYADKADCTPPNSVRTPPTQARIRVTVVFIKASGANPPGKGRWRGP